MLKLVRWVHSKLGKWYSLATILAFCTLIAFVVHSIAARVLVIAICLFAYGSLKFTSRKLLELLYASQAKGLLVCQVERDWLITYDQTNRRFAWEVLMTLNLMNLGHREITEAPYFEISSHYPQEDVTFEVFQQTSENMSRKIPGQIEVYTNSVYTSQAKPRKVFVIRRYIELLEPLEPKCITTLRAEVKYSHAKNLFEEEGFVGPHSRYARLTERIRLRVAMPLRIDQLKSNILSPLGVSDTNRLEKGAGPTIDSSRRVVNWELDNPLPDYSYYLAFRVKTDKEV
ncbi:MAG: hypothetical protein ACYTEL_14645 [Planctomycetota bacterium]|jgi:hypothetical protein